MLLYKNGKSYKCTIPKITTSYNKFSIAEFVVVESLHPEQYRGVVTDCDFYIYDAFLDKVLFDARGGNLIYVRLTYLENSTCRIRIKTIKGE